MRKRAVEKYGLTPVDTKWVDTDKAVEGEPMQIRSRMCVREFKSDDQRTARELFQSCTSTCHVRTSTRRPRDPC